MVEPNLPYKTPDAPIEDTPNGSSDSAGRWLFISPSILGFTLLFVGALYAQFIERSPIPSRKFVTIFVALLPTIPVGFLMQRYASRFAIQKSLPLFLTFTLLGGVLWSILLSLALQGGGLLVIVTSHFVGGPFAMYNGLFPETLRKAFLMVPYLCILSVPTHFIFSIFRRRREFRSRAA